MISWQLKTSNKIGRYFYRGFKMKNDQKVKKYANSDRALDHFDLHYRPVYKDKWPSIRISLLSAKKTCAVFNNFAENTTYIDKFKSQGAYDIIKEAETRQMKEAEKRQMKEAELMQMKEAEMRQMKEAETRQMEEAEKRQMKEAELMQMKEAEMRQMKEAETRQIKRENAHRQDLNNNSICIVTNKEEVTEAETEHNIMTNKLNGNVNADSDLSSEICKIFKEEIEENRDKLIELNSTSSNAEDDRKDLDRTNLYNFVPAEMVYSESQTLRIEEAKRSVYTPLDIKVDIVKPRKISLPMDLKVIGFPSGDVTEFPDVKSDRLNGLLCYFMMDAASVLPVIALDLEEGDNVLDLCAAPGGKTLAILQTGLADSLTCNDLSGSRNKRLFNILQYYIPEDERQHVTVTKRSGLAYDQPNFDKVLVDVPCNTDRHYLLEDDNNLFSPVRINDRIQMPTMQKDLLISGIKSCRPGGCVVYSTCTLSPAQNDGVIQNTLDDLWRNTNIDVVVEDLEEITDIFKDSFNFYKKCRFGQLVIPSLSLNYGPMYFSRLRRVA